MPSTRKQKAREKRSRQSDVVSDIETLDVMLGTYSKIEINSQLSGNEDNVDRRSNERQTNTNRSGDDFKTLLNTNSIGNSDMTSETVGMIHSEITSQVSSKMNEFKVAFKRDNRTSYLGTSTANYSRNFERNQ